MRSLNRATFLRTLLLTLAVTIWMPSLVSAQQTPGAAILGTWATLDGRLVVEFYDAGPAYAARFIYGDLIVEADGKTLKKDLKNPDPSLRSRSLADVDFVSGLVWDVSERRWENGVVYQANAGRTGSAHATVEGDTLNLRAYRGLPVAGRTIVFKRRPG